MPIATVNATFVTPDQWKEATRGMTNVVEVKVLPAMEIYRFASAAKPHTWFTGSWWFGKSAYEGLLRLEKSSSESLSAVARRCLAVPPEWSTMDVLLAVRVLQPLSALSGTPRTQRLKDRGRYGKRFEPDRTITQLYIPGLDPKKHDGEGVAWNEVLAGSPRLLSRGT